MTDLSPTSPLSIGVLIEQAQSAERAAPSISEANGWADVAYHLTEARNAARVALAARNANAALLDAVDAGDVRISRTGEVTHLPMPAYAGA